MEHVERTEYGAGYGAEGALASGAALEGVGESREIEEWSE